MQLFSKYKYICKQILMESRAFKLKPTFKNLKTMILRFKHLKFYIKKHWLFFISSIVYYNFKIYDYFFGFFLRKNCVKCIKHGGYSLFI